MRVGIVGSRDYPHLDLVRSFVHRLAAKYPDATVVSGGARGVDTAAAEAADDAGLAIEVFPADWKHGGRGAGFARNQTIIDRSDRLVAFTIGSNGTADSIAKARAKPIPVTVYGPDGKVVG